jgi:aminoglycoside phosphotransferase (APT) family kinase protein
VTDVERPLRGSGRFTVSAVDGSPGRVIKRGPAGPLAREARALRLVAGLGVAPQLVRSALGVIVTGLIAGAEARLDRLSPSDARALGRTLRAVHDARRSATGWLPGWRSRAGSVDAYRRRRAGDARDAAGPEAELADRVVAALPPLGGASVPPFRLLHGDLVSANVLWTPEPRLVDWEFWRMGDPAEDLAYLAEVNAMPDAVMRHVLSGYADRAVAARIDGWRALCALDAGLWYLRAGPAADARRLLQRAASLSDVRARRPRT